MDSFVDFWSLLMLMFLANLGFTKTENLVNVNKGIQVERGRVAYVTENELQFNIPKDRDSCKVEVVQNEPITQRVGKLIPQVFDCHFLPDEVKYIHNGSPLLEEDIVMLRLYRFSKSDTTMETFTLKVQIIEPQNRIVTLVVSHLEVPEFYGISNPLDGDVLTVQYVGGRPNVICTVRIMSKETFVPAHGQLVTEDPTYQKRGDVPDFHSTAKANKVRRSKLHCPGNKACLPGYKEVNFLKASCEDFLRMGLKYQHLTPPSPDIDYIPLQVELRDSKSRVLLQTQNIWIPVKINQAVPNMQPQAAFMSMFILEADQFILTPLTTAVIDARDDETPKDNLVFNITNPPVEGYITHLDDHTKPITSFIWQDLHEMKIAYQPSNGSHAERKNFEVEFQVSDSAFKNSPTIMVHFSIRSTETNAPRVSWNMGLDILEGQSHPITWEKFQIVDNDNIDAVRLVTVEGLQHGRLTVRGGKGFMFTVKDIKEGVVHYHHDDSDTTKDFIVFRIFDGKHSIRHKFPINILPKDDSPPFLINNIDFELAEGGTILIQEHMLLASDFDSSDDYILYNITIAPAAGQILKKLNLDGPGVPVSSFLQRDLYHGLIYYHHLGGEIFKDFFEFILSDSHEPPNLSDKHSVTIHIIPVKDQLPQEVSGVLRHLVVKETDIVYFTKHHLNFVDPESPENDLMYIVTKPCFSPGLSRAYDAGKVIFTDKLPSMKKDPTAPLLRSFSQHAVNHLKVAYMPPDEDIGPDPLFVQFEFSVNDQQGGMVSGLVFNITVMPVDNQAPKMFTNAIQAEEGATSYITDKNLVIEDTDTRLHDVRVQLRKKPHHGDVLLHGHVLLEGDYFTTEDVKSFKVSYRHDDSESLEDLIGFRVTDGNNTSDGVLNVKVIPVNDEPPELHSDLKSGLQCPEGGHVIITAEYLYAKDEDSDDNKLTYMIARVPLYGVVKKEKVAVDKFSQLDVIQGLVSYTHTGGEIGCTPHVDTVTLIVSDGEAGTIESCCFDGPHPPPIPLHGNLPVYDLNITVLPVNNQAPTVKAGEVFMVDEGSTACLTVDYLNALDEDTLPEEIKFILETSPTYGYLENTLPSPGHEKSNSGIQIADFNLHHLLAGYINYVQSNHTGVEPRTDQFMISVTDGVHKSVVMPFFIVINPANDESPELQLNNITIMEGDICELGPATLNALDIDSPADTLYFSIVKPPVHGLILNGIYGSNIERYKQMSSTMLRRDLSVQSFIMDELKQGMTLMYLHDDTESLKDSFTIQLTDGKYTVQGTVYVHVIPINDERPQLYRNTGLEVNVAESKVISSVALEAEDKDTPRNKLYYILSNEPKFGQLSLKGHLEWLILHSGMNFTQEDVDMNQIWYRHIPNQDLKRHDGFHFFVTDGENNSPSEIFYISIKMSEKGDIVLLTKPVTLTEGDRVTLMTDVLMATDGSGKPEELLYAVSVPPVHGQIEYINYPGVPISSFSQLDVVAQKVCYVHDNSHEANKDAFSFVISNGLSDKNGSLEFAIEHRDRIPPTLNNNKGLQLLEGGMHVISSDDLELADPDSPLENLTFRITQHPQHGTLYLKEGILNHNNFTQKNVNNMDVYYKHNGGSAELDRFYFTATDGNNPGFLVSGLLREDPIAFIIQIEHIDKASPRIITNKVATTVEQLKDGRSVIYITSKNLKASDIDSKDEDLIFTVLRMPYYGYLENAKTGSYIAGMFTQKILNQRSLRYIINPSNSVTLDSFEFKVIDPAGNTIVPELFQMKWSRIEMSETYYHVCENIGTLSIKVQRSGYSEDPSFVTIKIQDVSTRTGLDFTHSRANLIQFDPGVFTKSWNVFINDDGLEENNEKFKVLLSSPRNAVLAERHTATVEIIDPRRGNCDVTDFTSDTEVSERENGGEEFVSRLHSNNGTKGEQQDIRISIMTEQRLKHYTIPHRGHAFQQPSFSEHHGTKLRDDRTLEITRTQLQAIKNIKEYHSIVPLRIEEQYVPQLNAKVTDSWAWSSFPFHLARTHDLPQRDSAYELEAIQSDSDTKEAHTGRKCPSRWVIHGALCYLLNSYRNVTWEAAEKDCKQQFHSHLTSVHSKKEMKWLWKFAKKQPFWIGLTYKNESDSWEWTNARPLSFSNLKKRHRSLKNLLQPKCVLVQQKNKWIPNDCDLAQKAGYICSFSAARL